MQTPAPKRWRVRDYDRGRARSLAARLSLSPVVAGLLVARGVDDEHSARRLLAPSYDQLHDPSLMLGMAEATARVLRAIDAGEKILIYGDYDVDGTTGTVVLRRALQILGAQTSYHVPHRFTEGYGIRQDVLERARADGFTLAISVDCGIRAHEPLEWARANGLDVIVTDHHLPDKDEGAPPAFAVLNANQRGCDYPDKHLAGVCVAFKLAHSLLRERGRENLIRGFLKVVAIGTVADMAPLVGENRSIVTLGLNDLANATNPGLRALMQIAGLDPARATCASDLGFKIGPRINAAGRMDAARAVVELFEATDEAEALRLAEHLDALNRERQVVQREITERAILELDSHGECGAVAVVAGAGWHRGVIGLAASKIAERLNRPAVVISLDEDGTGHGSARSAGDYHLLDGLTTCADLFESFGGHAQAAGLRIRREKIDELRRRLNDHAAPFVGERGCEPVVEIDAEISSADLSLALAGEVKQLEPFGVRWECPVFASRDFRLAREPRVLKGRHFKFHLAGADGREHEALWWGAAESETATPRVGQGIELAYRVETNTWRDETRLQLIVEDMRAASIVNRQS